MKPKDISQAKNPDLRASLAALQRAAQDARRIAIQTDTAIIVMRDGKRVRVTADELRKEQEALEKREYSKRRIDWHNMPVQL